MRAPSLGCIVFYCLDERIDGRRPRRNLRPLLLTRSRSGDEPVAGGVRAAVEAGSGDASRDADSGRAVARRELGELISSRLAIPAATTMNRVIGTSLVRPTTARS
jgi:hypothetical protein